MRCEMTSLFEDVFVNFLADPHVKVEGKKENVQQAKKKILELLETKVSKHNWFGLPNTIHIKLWKKITNWCDRLHVVLLSVSFYPKVNKVTLKMDVTHTEHSHVIGKGGGNIKKVMELTLCHIHFPDSNRHNATGEKSNQVLLPSDHTVPWQPLYDPLSITLLSQGYYGHC